MLCDNLGVSQPLDVVKELQKGLIWSDHFLSDNNLDTNEEFLDDSVASISRLARSLGTLSRPTRAVVALVSTIYLSTFKNRLQVSLNFEFYRIHDHNRGDEGGNQLLQVLKQSADSKKRGMCSDASTSLARTSPQQHCHSRALDAIKDSTQVVKKYSRSLCVNEAWVMPSTCS